MNRCRLSFIVLSVVASPLGCSDDGMLGAAEDTSGGPVGTTANVDRDTGGLSGQSPTATSGSVATSTTGGENDNGSGAPDTGLDSAGFISGGTTGGPAGGQPNGSECFADETCESGHCYIGFNGGGVCSECSTDADCETGGCQFSFQMGAFCNDGNAGGACESDDACMEGLTCETVFDGGVFGSGRCSTCASDADCAGPGQVCGPVTTGGLGSAYLDCVDPMSVPDGGLCPVDAMGTTDGTVCVSGQCATTTVFMGMITIGICSECDADDDCAPMQTCAPPDFTMGMVTPGACQ